MTTLTQMNNMSSPEIVRFCNTMEFRTSFEELLHQRLAIALGMETDTANKLKSTRRLL